MSDFFVELLRKEDLSITEQQLSQFETYYQELKSWNERMNLTSITERNQVYLKHFYDSLTLSFHVPMKSIHTLIDIGSGAGFPGLPLKIMFPHIQLTIVDSLNKRIQFLNHMTRILGLSDVLCIHGRAEDLAHQVQHRDTYDLATARAVARLNVLSELCLPFVRIGGLFVAMKGSDPTDEIREAEYSLNQLNGHLENVISLQIPVENADRNLIMIKKNHRTPARYPRKPGIPSKEPLVKNR